MWIWKMVGLLSVVMAVMCMALSIAWSQELEAQRLRMDATLKTLHDESQRAGETLRELVGLARELQAIKQDEDINATNLQNAIKKQEASDKRFGKRTQLIFDVLGHQEKQREAHERTSNIMEELGEIAKQVQDEVGELAVEEKQEKQAHITDRLSKGVTVLSNAVYEKVSSLGEYFYHDGEVKKNYLNPYPWYRALQRIQDLKEDPRSEADKESDMRAARDDLSYQEKYVSLWLTGEIPPKPPARDIPTEQMQEDLLIAEREFELAPIQLKSQQLRIEMAQKDIQAVYDNMAAMQQKLTQAINTGLEESDARLKHVVDTIQTQLDEIPSSLEEDVAHFIRDLKMHYDFWKGFRDMQARKLEREGPHGDSWSQDQIDKLDEWLGDLEARFGFGKETTQEEKLESKKDEIHMCILTDPTYGKQ